MSDEELYRENILDLYKHPHNAGAIKNPSFTHRELNRSCGDDVEISARIDDGIIKDIKFQGKSCAICTASASMMTDAVKNKPTEFAYKLGAQEVQKMLGIHISPVRMKCAMLPVMTLQNGLANYEVNVRARSA